MNLGRLAVTNSGEGGEMDSILPWIVAALGIGIVAFALIGFLRGFALPPNPPEHRARGNGDNWRT